MPGGCQQKIAEKVAEKAVEAQGGGKVDLNVGSGSVNITGDLKDIVYPGARVEATYEAEDGKAMAMSTDKSPEEVAAFYVKKFGKPAVKAMQENGISMVWENGLSVTAVADKDGGITRIMVGRSTR